MNRRLAKRLGSIALAALLASSTTALADPPGRHNDDRPRHGSWHGEQRRGHVHDVRVVGRPGPPRHVAYAYPPRGAYVTQLPHRYRVVHYRGAPYYYAGGAWYRPHGPRYVVVTPPIGLAISFLPDVQATLLVGGIPYYRYGPVYYVWQPQARAYVVTGGPNWGG
jgi:hypothetical protein